MCFSLLVYAAFNKLPEWITTPASEFLIFCHPPLLDKEFRFPLINNLYSLCTLGIFSECKYSAVTKFLSMESQYLFLFLNCIPHIFSLRFRFLDLCSCEVIGSHYNMTLLFSFKPLCILRLWGARWKGNADIQNTKGVHHCSSSVWFALSL